MTWTEITDRDICIQGQENKINCIASGAIKAGQAVSLADGSDSTVIYVAAGDTGGYPLAFKAIGVAATDADTTKPVAVYVGQAICWGRADGTGVERGDYLYTNEDGLWKDTTETTEHISGAAISLTTQDTDEGLIKVKLL